jgi:hypothetical protein
MIAAATDRIPAPSEASATRSRAPRNSRAQPPCRSNRSPRYNPGHCQGLTPQPGNNGGERGGGGDGGHSVNGGVTKTMGLTTIQEVATTPTARAIPVTMGEILGIDPCRRHVSLRVNPVTWWVLPHLDTGYGPLQRPAGFMLRTSRSTMVR